MRLTEPRLSSLLDGWFARKDYLQINIFPDLIVVEQEESFYALLKKATKGATSEVVREKTNYTWSGLALGISKLASTSFFLYGGDGRR